MPRKPEGKSYEYKLGDMQKPFYRMTEVLIANVVMICEGEKDCDRVAGLNLSERDPRSHIAATTNFDGVGKWRNEYSPVFAGKSVAISINASSTVAVAARPSSPLPASSWESSSTP